METLKQNVGDGQLTTTTQSPDSVREYSDPIPIDLLIDIFSRVPAKSIARFRCVSKLWASILNRPDFTELFLTKSLTRPRFLFSFKVNKELFVFSAPQPQNLDENSSLVATRYKYFPKYFPTRISNSLSGLVLLRILVFHGSRGTKELETRVICNPVTGKFITLPEVKGTGTKTIYFCFDPIKKEFKVLCMTLSDSKITYQVLTLDTRDHLWRRIQDPLFPHIPWVYAEICINGVLYYIADKGGYDYVIVCFNVRSEKFGFINIDKDMRPGHLGSLFNYKGKLGVHPSRYSVQEEFVLWVLDDDGKHKWSKIICIIPPSWSKRVSGKKIGGMTSTGEIVFSPDRLSNPLYLYYYNVERRTFTRIRIKGFEEFIKHHKIPVSVSLNYVENMKFM